MASWSYETPKEFIDGSTTSKKLSYPRLPAWKTILYIMHFDVFYVPPFGYICLFQRCWRKFQPVPVCMIEKVGSIRLQPPTFLELESRSSFERDLLVCTSKGRIFNQCRKFFILHQFWPAFNASKLQVTLLFWHGSGGGRGALVLARRIDIISG